MIPKLGIQILQNPAAPRKPLSCFLFLGSGSAQTASLLPCSKVLIPWLMWYPKYLTWPLHSCAFFFETLYPLSQSSCRSSFVAFQHSFGVSQAKSKSSTYCKRTCFWGTVGNPCRSEPKAVPKADGKFLKPWGKRVQQCCVFRPVFGSSHWNANSGWLWGANFILKNASFKSKTVKHVAVCGMSPSSKYGLGTVGCIVTIVSFIALRSVMPGSGPGFGTGSNGVFHGLWMGLIMP